MREKTLEERAVEALEQIATSLFDLALIVEPPRPVLDRARYDHDRPDAEPELERAIVPDTGAEESA